MAIYASLYNLTEREIKHLKSSKVEIFSKKIFPFIKEERSRVIYSDDWAYRYNNPVNLCFWLLILREIFSQSDEEVLNSLLFNIRYQYTLYTIYTTSFKE